MNLKRFFILAGIYFGIQITGLSQTVFPDYRDGSVYLKIKDSSSLELAPYAYNNAQLNLLFTQYGVNVAAIRKPYPDATINLGLSKIYQMHCSDSTHIDSLISKLQKIGAVEYAEKEPVIHTYYTPNDINGNQWYLAKINATNAWTFTKGSPAVVIAIVDNAIRITHTDLVANIWTNPGEIPNNLIDDDFNGYTDDVHGFDIADHDNNPNPPPTTTNSSPFVHGTHCAGIAAATTDNGNGIAAIGFNSKIMAVKCSADKNDGSTLINSYDGVYYAMRAHANIISMSWGGTGSFATGQSVINAASQMGIVLVASAGNNDSNGVGYPAAYQNVIAVGSTDIDDAKSTFSNYGTAIDVMAPGKGIYSTLGGDDNAYGYLSGTSMSAPMVAGLAALVKALHPTYTPAQVENDIKSGCDNINSANPTKTGLLGAGRINAYRTFKPNVGFNPIENYATSPLNIHPNPGSGIFYYKLNNLSAGEIHVFVLNTLGQKVLSMHKMTDAGVAEGSIDMRDLPPGVYFLKAGNEGGMELGKFVVR